MCVGLGTITSDEECSEAEYPSCDFQELVLDACVTPDVAKTIKYPSVDLNNCMLPPMQSPMSEKIESNETSGSTSYELFAPNALTTVIQSWLKEVREDSGTNAKQNN